MREHWAIIDRLVSAATGRQPTADSGEGGHVSRDDEAGPTPQPSRRVDPLRLLLLLLLLLLLFYSKPSLNVRCAFVSPFIAAVPPGCARCFDRHETLERAVTRCPSLPPSRKHVQQPRHHIPFAALALFSLPPTEPPRLLRSCSTPPRPPTLATTSASRRRPEWIDALLATAQNLL